MRSVASHSDLWVRFAYKVGPRSREGGLGRGRALDRGNFPGEKIGEGTELPGTGTGVLRGAPFPPHNSVTGKNYLKNVTIGKTIGQF